MRKLFFRRPYLERLEDRNMLNMILGHLGTPGLGTPTANPDNPASDVSALIALNGPLEAPGNSPADIRFVLDFGEAIRGVSLIEVGADHSKLAPITSASASKEEIWTNATELGFDPFRIDLLDLGLSARLNRSPQLPGASPDLRLSSDYAPAGSMAALTTGSSASSQVSASSGGWNVGGSFGTGIQFQSAPMILLPPGHLSTPLHPGLLNGLSGPPQANPALRSGPNAVTGKILVTVPQPPYVPVNADNDNGSAVTNGIPAKRDFSVNPLPVNDPELLQGSVVIQGLPAGGTWTLSLGPPPSKIALWKDQMKTAPFTAADAPGIFYIEGLHESANANDFAQISFTYTPPRMVLTAGSGTVLVTPIINSFTVTPAGGANGQNINFVNGVDGGNGVQAFIPGPPIVPGASFGGNLTVTALNGNPVLIQNYINAQNGANGTTFKFNPVGYLFAAGTNPPAANLVLIQGTFPVLDTENPRPATPEYDVHVQVTNDGNTATIKAKPDTGIPPNVGQGTFLDVLSTLRLWLVWKYPSGIYYPLAFINWQANFYASAVGNNLFVGPVNKIQVPHGVTAGSFTPSNATPDRMNAPVFNGNNQWVAA
jgi:hypothetical protein